MTDLKKVYITSRRVNASDLFAVSILYSMYPNIKIVQIGEIPFEALNEEDTVVLHRTVRTDSDKWNFSYNKVYSTAELLLKKLLDDKKMTPLAYSIFNEVAQAISADLGKRILPTGSIAHAVLLLNNADVEEMLTFMYYYVSGLWATVQRKSLAQQYWNKVTKVPRHKLVISEVNSVPGWKVHAKKEGYLFMIGPNEKDSNNWNLISIRFKKHKLKKTGEEHWVHPDGFLNVYTSRDKAERAAVAQSV